MTRRILRRRERERERGILLRFDCSRRSFRFPRKNRRFKTFLARRHFAVGDNATAAESAHSLYCPTYKCPSPYDATGLSTSVTCAQFDASTISSPALLYSPTLDTWTCADNQTPGGWPQSWRLPSRDRETRRSAKCKQPESFHWAKLGAETSPRRSSRPALHSADRKSVV